MLADTVTTTVRPHIMREIVDRGHVPTAVEAARDLDIPIIEAEVAYRRLHDSHVIVLAAGDGRTIRMANPFSAVPTSFRVTVGDRSWWGNCIWDSPGIVAMLGGSGIVSTNCPDCDEPLQVVVLCCSRHKKGA